MQALVRPLRIAVLAHDPFFFIRVSLVFALSFLPHQNKLYSTGTGLLFVPC